MLVTHVSHKCLSQMLVNHTHLITEGHVTFLLLLSYTPSPWLWTDKLHFPSYYHTPSPRLRKDKLHFPSSCHTHLVVEGQAIHPIQLPHLPGYGRSSYIYHPATTTIWLQKDKLHIPYSYHTHLVMKGQVTFTLQPHPIGYRRRFTHPLQLPHPPYYGRTCFFTLLSFC